MGKVHRIKKRFWKLLSQEPLPVGIHQLVGYTNLRIGKRYDGSVYLLHTGWQHQHKPLVNKLIQAYEAKQAEVAHSDKTPIKE